MNKHTIATLLLGFSSLAFFAFIMPEYQALKGARAGLASRQLLLADLMKAQENIRTLDNQYTEQEGTIQKVLLALPKEKQYDSLTESFQAAAQQADVVLMSLNIADPQKGQGDYQIIPVKAEISGRYGELLSFLEALESSLRLYDIIKIEIAESPGGPFGSELTINLQVNAYSLK